MSDLVLVLGIITVLIAFTLLVMVFVFFELLEIISHYKSILVFTQMYGVILSLKNVVVHMFYSALTPDETLEFIGSSYAHTRNKRGEHYGKWYWAGENPAFRHINWRGVITEKANNAKIGDERPYSPVGDEREPIDEDDSIWSG